MIDPELAAMVDLLPMIDLVDPVAARRAFEEILVAIRIDIPGLETLDIDDRMVPGWEGDPDVPVRVYRPARPRRRHGARHRHDPRRRLRDRQRRGRARRRGPHRHRHRRRRRLGRLPPGARAPLPGRPARLLRRARRSCTPRPTRWASTRAGGPGRRERRRRAGGGHRPAGPRPRRPAGLLPDAADPRARRPAPDRLHAGLRRLAAVEPAARRAELAGLPRAALRDRRRAGLRRAGPGRRPLGAAAGLHLHGRERSACATRGSPTPSACSRPASRWSCTSSRAPSTARRW